MAHDVFISYSSRDKSIADAICASLENAKIRCWIAPRDVIPGKEWGEAIVDAISASKVMVLIFSEASNNSQQVLREVERAVNKNVVIVPFRIEPVVPTKSMEYFLYSTHWLDALTPDVQKHIEVLVETVAKLMDKEISAETTSKPFKVVTPNKPKLKLQMVLLIILGVILAGFGVYGMASLLTRNQQAAVLPTGSPTLSSSPLSETDNPAGSETLPSETSEPGSNQNTEPGTSPAAESQPGGQGEGQVAANPGTSGHETRQNPSEQGQSSGRQNGTGAQAPAASEAKTKLKAGQILRFGSYYGKPIDWMVIHVDNEGKPLLLTTHILTLKPFDASESGTYNKTGDVTFDNKKPKDEVYTSYTTEEMIAMKGSNSWASSNLRQWLNSDQKKVSYSTQAPSASAVWGGYNDYDKEMGFLYNFTETEKALIKKVKNKSVVSITEKDKAVGGSALYNFSRSSLEDAWHNTDEAYYTYVEDKIFLLSVEEALSYIYDKGQLLKAYLTEEAKERDESNWYNDLKHQDGGAFMWWLRTPNANTPCEVCIVGTTGDIIYSDYAVLSGIGVRPACYLTTSELEVTGSGTADDPYVLK